MTRKTILAAAAALLFALPMSAQTQKAEEPAAPEGYKYIDSVVFNAAPRYNQELAGKSIFDVLPSEVKVHQSTNLKNAVDSRIRDNKSVQTDGFRIRIYFDNKQDSREASSATEQRFRKLFPGYTTYRTFKNPFFKVTIGDFRTKAEAQVALEKISKEFPSAFIVKEKMRFPVIADGVRYTTDTLRVLVPIAQPANE